VIRRLLARLRGRRGPMVIGTSRWRSLTPTEWREEDLARRDRIEWLATERRHRTSWVRRRHPGRPWL
jgi:hypothetical protein